jgi:hypothetical protein
MKDNMLRRTNVFYEMNSIYADLLPVLAQLLYCSFRCGLNREFSQPKE